ncbi:MAG: tRNA epoxyqueuosine(34) reductase QueG [Planctomycetia bacterium]|nr:tRNA epoxyqueuosine(34) reductase QueG [Planctomycetia bacterium]
MQPSQTAAAFNPAAIATGLREEAVRLGFSRVGITTVTAPPHHEHFRTWLARDLAGATSEWLVRHEPLRRSAEAVLEGVQSVVMLATDHAAAPPAVEPGQGRGRVARYAWGDDYHDLLRDRSNRLGAWLEARVPGCRTRGVVDSAPLAERDFAWLAGLGWFGKNTMLIDPSAGSYFLLTALLTDVAFPANMPIQADHCGTCTACLDACPTGALVEPRVLDANRCISSLTIEQRRPIATDLREGMGAWIFGCDVCQEVCPWNRHAPGSVQPTFQPRGGETSLSLAGILRMDPREFRRHFKGSALLRPKRAGLLRSAAIALGNHPHPPSFEPLAAALDDAEPVIRGAAAWALGRWIAAGVLEAGCRAALARRREIETDEDVRAEIVAAGG